MSFDFDSFFSTLCLFYDFAVNAFFYLHSTITTARHHRQQHVIDHNNINTNTLNPCISSFRWLFCWSLFLCQLMNDLFEWKKKKKSPRPKKKIKYFLIAFPFRWNDWNRCELNKKKTTNRAAAFNRSWVIVFYIIKPKTILHSDICIGEPVSIEMLRLLLVFWQIAYILYFHTLNSTRVIWQLALLL